MAETLTDFDQFVNTLNLPETAPDRYLGVHPRQVAARTFGGQILSQAIIAGGRTVDGPRPLHVLHCHFIRGGDVTKDIEYRVTRLRDTRTTANRHISVEQDGEVLAVLLAGYQSLISGALVHSDPIPEVPEPETLARVEEYFVGYEDVISMFIEAPRPMDMRFTNDPTWLLRSRGETLDVNRVWIKADGTLPDDVHMHNAALAYASDTTILDSIVTRHGLSWGTDRLMAVTLNQSIWFHRAIQFDDYALYATHSAVAEGGRASSNGYFFGRDGKIAASVTQEGVMKYFPPRGKGPGSDRSG